MVLTIIIVATLISAFLIYNYRVGKAEEKKKRGGS